MMTCPHQSHYHPARGTRGREGRWGAMLFVALVLVSVAGARAFGANRTPPKDSGCFLTQVTHTDFIQNAQPAINALGTRIAFSSFADLTGDNPNHLQELFLAHTTTGTFTQLTTGGGIGIGIAINALGTRIAFFTGANLTGGNPDGNFELFLVDTTTSGLTQLTTTSGTLGFGPAINALGTRIAFYSSADLTGDNPDGNEEIFLVDTTTDTFTQLTNTTGNVRNSRPVINALGTHIAFDSSADLTGDNPDGNLEIFLATCGAPGKEGKERSNLLPE